MDPYERALKLSIPVLWVLGMAFLIWLHTQPLPEKTWTRTPTSRPQPK